MNMSTFSKPYIYSQQVFFPNKYQSKLVLLTSNAKFQVFSTTFIKVQLGNDQEMAQLERNSHSKNLGMGKIN